MGDRGNIVICEEEGGKIYLYTHWRGSEIKDILAKALKRGRSRWDDEPYLTRIVFQTMLDGDEGETGFGISTYMVDNEHNILYVYPNKQQIEEKREGADAVTDVWTFDQFIKSQEATQK